MDYTIRLNLGGNLVSQLREAERLTNSIDRGSLGGRRGTGVGVGGGGGSIGSRYRYIPAAQMPAVQRYRQITSRFSGQTDNQYYSRFNEAFRQMGRFRSDFVRNSFTISGVRRNFGNFVGTLSSLNSAITSAVPVIRGLQLGVGAYALGFAASRIMPALAGGIIYSIGSRVLNSPQMTNAISSRMRMNMAREGLGGGYDSAAAQAGEIASVYGYSRAGVLSAINVLSGFRTDRGDISAEQATDLARIIGKVSQIGGRPYDIVSLNLQQILASSTPNLRDIREILNQAPILSKYALEEMRERGITGDPRQYLQDRDSLLRALNRLDEDVQPTGAAVARGRATLAREDFWINLSGMDDFWSLIGDATERLYGTFTRRIEEFSGMVSSSSIDSLLNNFTSGVDALIDGAIWIFEKISDIGQWFSRNQSRIETWLDPLSPFRGEFWFTSGRREDNVRIQTRNIRQNTNESSSRNLNDYISSIFSERASEIPVPQGRQNPDAYRQQRIESYTQQALREFSSEVSRYRVDQLNYALNQRGLNRGGPAGNNGLVYEYLSRDRLNEFLNSRLNTASTGAIAGNDAREIEDLTRGSRSLIINFNAPLSEVNNTINNASNPEAIVARLTPEIEERVRVGLRSAIAGASRMGGVSGGM